MQGTGVRPAAACPYSTGELYVRFPRWSRGLSRPQPSARRGCPRAGRRGQRPAAIQEASKLPPKTNPISATISASNIHLRDFSYLEFL